MSHKAKIHATLDAHPEWGEYGVTGPVYERFDGICAHFYQERGDWGDVLRSRIEAAGGQNNREQ